MNSEKVSLQFRDLRPKAITIALLGLRRNRFLYDPDAPLLFQVWALPENFLLEVIREAILRHNPKDYPTRGVVRRPPRWLTTWALRRGPLLAVACSASLG